MRARQWAGASLFRPLSLRRATRARTDRRATHAQGTFSQRHAILADQASERVAVPLQTLTNRPPASAAGAKAGEVGTFEVVNSPLSEYAVVGFEQGVAWVSPKLLPIWEAQVRRSRCSSERLLSPDHPLTRARGAVWRLPQHGPGALFRSLLAQSCLPLTAVCAQVVLDTYLGSGETKWGMQSALTLLLPHGFGALALSPLRFV